MALNRLAVAPAKIWRGEYGAGVTSYQPENKAVNNLLSSAR